MQRRNIVSATVTIPRGVRWAPEESGRPLRELYKSLIPMLHT